MTEQTWTDAYGQTYGPGDHIAVATISGRSPQLVIAVVERINTVDSKGQPIVTYVGWNPTTRQPITAPSCTVTARPVHDGRGFHRWSDRAVTYRIPGNIIKVPTPPAAAAEDQAA